MRRFTVLVALFALALPTFAQQQQPVRETIDVNAVLIDAIVTDPKGNQILGLTKDDFVVKENGVEQTVDSVHYFTNLRLLDAREQDAPFNVERVSEERYFIFFFDKPESTDEFFGQIALARKAVKDLLRDDFGATDRIAIVGHDVRLKVYSDFTSDRRQLERALDDVARFGGGVKDAPAGDGPSILRNIDRSELIDHTGEVYDALRVLAESLRPIRARKNLVLFSAGIVGREDQANGGLLTGRSQRFEPMIDALNAANITVYPLQLHRNAILAPIVHQRLEEIAMATGGEYYRYANNFRVPLDRIEDRNNGYYLITYRSNKPAGEKGFQKVDVSLRTRDLRVTARAGYSYGG